MIYFLRKVSKPTYVHTAYLLSSTALNIKLLFHGGVLSSTQIAVAHSFQKCYFATCTLYKLVMTVCHSLLSTNNQTGHFSFKLS